mgnify:CR=1 FL=1|tara:strand:- start:1124 stop:1735 length:612 start_codon:yes stop_codon:yes gene_type:complete
MSKSQAEFNALPENVRLARVLSGTFYYPSVHAPNTSGVKLFGSSPVFTVKVGLDATNKKIAEEIGLTIKPASEAIPEEHVEVKRKVDRIGEDGTSYNKQNKAISVEVVDSMQNKFPKTLLVGNGSKGSVKFATYWYDNNGGGVGTSLYKMQVTSLVEFEHAKDDDFVTDDTGFSISDVVADDVPFDMDTPKEAQAVGASLFDD